MNTEAHMHKFMNIKTHKDVGSVVLAWIFCLSKTPANFHNLLYLANDRASVGLLSSFPAYFYKYWKMYLDVQQK